MAPYSPFAADPKRLKAPMATSATNSRIRAYSTSPCPGARCPEVGPTIVASGAGDRFDMAAAIAPAGADGGWSAGGPCPNAHRVRDRHRREKSGRSAPSKMVTSANGRPGRFLGCSELGRHQGVNRRANGGAIDLLLSRAGRRRDSVPAIRRPRGLRRCKRGRADPVAGTMPRGRSSTRSCAGRHAPPIPRLSGSGPVRWSIVPRPPTPSLRPAPAPRFRR